MRLLKGNTLWLLLSLFIVALDQASKYWVLENLQFQRPLVLNSFFNLNLNFNQGAAFSLLSNAGGWQIHLFQAISIFVSVILLIWLLTLKNNQKIKALALSLIMGGAIGNLIDRVRLNYVVDFFDFHINTWHFATFNVADAAVCVGAFFLILTMMFQKN